MRHRFRVYPVIRNNSRVGTHYACEDCKIFVMYEFKSIPNEFTSCPEIQNHLTVQYVMNS